MSNLSQESILDIGDKAQEIVDANYQKPNDKDDRPSILYCCPGSVLDITSGAAISLSTLLRTFARFGFRATALQATIFDSGYGGEHIMKAGLEQQKDKPIWHVKIDDVDHLIVRASHFRRHLMTVQQEETYINLFRNELKHRKPDFILLWGGLVLEREIMREARDANVPIVFYLVNPGYKDATVFKDVDVIMSDSQATADLYKQRHNFDCKVIGKFIDKSRVVPPVPRNPQFITMINPSFEKGVSFFMPLAKLAAKKYPNIKFLVCESRGRWGEAMKRFKLTPLDFPNVTVIGHQQDMRKIYEVTRALLLPSLWHESGARVIGEAQLNGIPVFASDTGGSSELIEGGGKVFPMRDEIRDKKGEILATEADLIPWLDEIDKLWSNQEYYQALANAALKSAQKFDVERSFHQLIDAVTPAVIKSKGGNVSWPIYSKIVKNPEASNPSKEDKNNQVKKTKTK